MQTNIFSLFHQKTAPAVKQANSVMETKQTAATHVPKEFSMNATILGSRYWIKGDAHLLDNGTITAYAQQVWDKDLRLSVAVREGTPLYFAMKERITEHLSDRTFSNYLVYDCSIHF
jgi:exoribonuclease II